MGVSILSTEAAEVTEIQKGPVTRLKSQDEQAKAGVLTLNMTAWLAFTVLFLVSSQLSPPTQEVTTQKTGTQVWEEPGSRNELLFQIC